MTDTGTETQDYDLEERLIAFAVGVMNVVEALSSTRAGNHVAGQLLRSGTSAAFHYGEVQSAESRNDFIHKMKVCLKELREARVALVIVGRKPLLPSPQVDATLAECEELIRIFRASIQTAERNRPKRSASRRREARGQ